MQLTHKQRAQPLALISNSKDRFPIRRIFCVGRNYAAHVREMGKDPDREPPFFFTKWADTYVPSEQTIPYPLGTSNLQYEVELVVAIQGRGSAIPVAHAREYVFGYGVGIDLTRRDLQLEAREKGRPWDTGKNFDRAAPMGPIHPASTVGHLVKGRIRLHVNGATKQDSDLSNMIWSVDEIIAYLSTLYEIGPGDLIFSGTPEGVGPLVPGDHVVATIDSLDALSISIGNEGEGRD